MKLVYRNRAEKWWLRLRLEITLFLIFLAKWIIPEVPEEEEQSETTLQTEAVGEIKE